MMRLAFLVLSAAVLVSTSVIRPKAGFTGSHLKPNTVQPFSPVGECHGHEDGTPTYLPDSDDCQKYYECNNGSPVPNVCPGKLLWNSILHVCDFPENVKCDKLKKGKPVGECHGHEDGTPTYLPDSDDCQIYYECNNGVPISNVCPGELQWNSVLHVCDFPGNVKCGEKSRKIQPKSIHPFSPVGECHGHEDGTPTYLPDSDDCQIYYECNNGFPVANVFPGKLQWNSILHVCDFPQNVKCGENFQKIIRKTVHPFSPVGECHGHEDGTPTYLPDSDDCQIYYECNNGFPVANECPGKLQWNSILHVCDFPENVKCDKSKNVKPYLAVGQCPDKPGSTPVYLPDDEDCLTFYECSYNDPNGIPVKLNCAPGSLFDSISRICVTASQARCYNDAS